MFFSQNRHFKIVLIFVALSTIVWGGSVSAQKQNLGRPAHLETGDRIETATGDSWNVNLLGRWSAGPCFGVATTGVTAYFGNGAYLEIVSFSTPSAPVEWERCWFRVSYGVFRYQGITLTLLTTVTEFE